MIYLTTILAISFVMVPLGLVFLVERSLIVGLAVIAVLAGCTVMISVSDPIDHPIILNFGD